MKHRSTAPGGGRPACLPLQCKSPSTGRSSPLRLGEGLRSSCPTPRQPLPPCAPSQPHQPLPGPQSSVPMATAAHGNGGPWQRAALATGRGGPEAVTSLLPADGKMAVAAPAELQRLQWRLEELEQRVGGGDGTCGSRKVTGGEFSRQGAALAAEGPGPAPPPLPSPRGQARGQAQARRCVTGPSPSSLPLQVADELVKVQVALSNIAGKRERVKILFKKSERPRRGGVTGRSCGAGGAHTALWHLLLKIKILPAFLPV